MTDPLTITIRRRVPSGNKSTFGHWSQYRKERDVWYALLRAALTPKEKPAHRVSIKIISFRVQLLDKGNLIHGCKSILDGLVKLGYLQDDSPKWVDDEYEQRKCPRKDEVTIVHLKNP